MSNDDRIASLLEDARRHPAEPWRDGDNIPWHDPDFSRRMLHEHLSQAHDRASRRAEMVAEHVRFLHERVLGGRRTKVLDLACGPGLYTSRLAVLGHTCIGIDYSPASILYADDAQEARCFYLCDDIRRADYGGGFGLVLLLSGELNVFRAEDAKAILRKAHAAMLAGARLVIEPHTEAAIERTGRAEPIWYRLERGLFSDRPHLYLQEHSWHEPTRTATVRYFIVDRESDAVTTYAQTYQAYSDEAYRELLDGCGFGEVETYPSLTGRQDDGDGSLIAIVATRR